MRWRQRTDIEDVGRSLAVYLSRILLLLLLLWPSLASAAKEPGEEVAANLQHAWSFYWAGLLDGGDLRSFDKGLGYAKQAKEQINKLPENDPTRAELEKKHDEVVDTIQKHMTFFVCAACAVSNRTGRASPCQGSCRVSIPIPDFSCAVLLCACRFSLIVRTRAPRALRNK